MAILFPLLVIAAVATALFIVLIVSLMLARLFSGAWAVETPHLAKLALSLAVTDVLASAGYAMLRNGTARYVGEWDLMYWFIFGLIGSTAMLLLIYLPWRLIRFGVPPGRSIGMSFLSVVLLAVTICLICLIVNPVGFTRTIRETVGHRLRVLEIDYRERTRIKGEKLDDLLGKYAFLSSDEIPYVHLWKGGRGVKYKGRYSALLDHDGEDEEKLKTPLEHAQLLRSRMEKQGYSVTIGPGIVTKHSCPGYGPRIDYQLFEVDAQLGDQTVECHQDKFALHFLEEGTKCAVQYHLEVK